MENTKMGRPTKYSDEYNEKVFKLALLGATDAEMADLLDICEATFNNWKRYYPKFLESLKKGKANADANVAKSLYQRACGYSHPDVHISNYQGEIIITETTKHYPPDTGAAFIWLKNRRPEDWRDKTEQAITHSESIDMAEIDRELAEAAKVKAEKMAQMRADGLVGKYE